MDNFKIDREVKEALTMDAEEEYWNHLLKFFIVIINICWGIDLYCLHSYSKPYSGNNYNLIILTTIAFVLFQFISFFYFYLFNVISVTLVYIFIILTGFVSIFSGFGFWVKMDTFNHYLIVLICSINNVLILIVFIIIQLYHSSYVIYIAKKKQSWRIVSMKDFFQLLYLSYKNDDKDKKE